MPGASATRGTPERLQEVALALHRIQALAHRHQLCSDFTWRTGTGRNTLAFWQAVSLFKDTARFFMGPSVVPRLYLKRSIAILAVECANPDINITVQMPAAPQIDHGIKVATRVIIVELGAISGVHQQDGVAIRFYFYLQTIIPHIAERECEIGWSGDISVFSDRAVP